MEDSGLELNPQVVQLGPQVLLRILEKYLETQPPLIQDIQSAHEDGNLDKLRDAAHSLKGSSSTLGLDAMAAVCRELENASKDGDPSATTRLVESVAEEGNRLEKALEAYLDKLRRS